MAHCFISEKVFSDIASATKNTRLLLVDTEHCTALETDKLFEIVISKKNNIKLNKALPVYIRMKKLPLPFLANSN